MARSAERATIASPTCQPALMSCATPTNSRSSPTGPSCLQREQLTAAGLDHYFDVVAISGEFGVGKPEPSIFEHTLSLLGSDPYCRGCLASSRDAPGESVGNKTPVCTP